MWNWMGDCWVHVGTLVTDNVRVLSDRFPHGTGHRGPAIESLRGLVPVPVLSASARSQRQLSDRRVAHRCG
jgi:hypothetical protein